MPAPPAIARQAAMLAALFGCALAIGPARRADASACHVADRPIFGLSSPSVPSPTPIATAEGGSDPVRIDPRCPSEDPEPPSSRPLAAGEVPMAKAPEPVPPASPGASLRPPEERSRPVPNPDRIDRPPRDR